MTEHTMKSLLIAATLLFLARVSSAQSPYWQPVDGPFENVTSVSLRDSLVSTKIGASYYSYDAATGSWKMFGYHAPQQMSWPYALYPNLTSAAALHNDTAYFSAHDSVFFTSDFGFDWKYVGSFGSPIVNSVKSIFELPSGATVIQNSLGTLYFSYNAFRTYDSSHVPATVRLSTNGDTLFYLDPNANLFGSSDIGKHWNALQALNDTVSTDRWYFTVFPSVYVLRDIYGYLAYSRDGGQTFVRMKLPIDSVVNNIQFGDGDRFYGYFFSNSMTAYSYRSDDWGQTWKKISYYPTIIGKAGELYSSNFRSSDYGNTWSTLTARGLIGVPGSMATWRDTTFLSTDQGIYKSFNNGTLWAKYASDSGVFGHLHHDTLTVNTISLLMPAGYLKKRLGFNLKKPDIGAIMDSGIVFVRDQGRLMASEDSAASFYPFFLDENPDMKNILPLTTDTALVVFSHAMWKVKDVVTGVQVTLPSSATPSGALCEDSAKAIYVGLSDGSLLVSHDRASTWQTFRSPVSTPNTIVTTLTAGRAGVFWAITQDTNTRRTHTYLYDANLKTWSDITASIPQTDTTIITNIWYVNDYVYAGTSDVGLYRSVNSSRADVHTARREQSGILLSPNPVTRSLVITGESSNHYSISVIDVTGRELMHEVLEADRFRLTLDCSTLAPGMYFARISNGERTRTAKFIKQ
jgi:hypothetical protein